MKETLETKDLREALTKCGVAVSRRSMLASIVGVVAIESKDEKVVVKSTDLGSYVFTTIKHSAAEPFSYCLPYKPLLQFVGKGNDQTVFSHNGGKSLTIERPKIGKANLWMGTEAKDYPAEPTYSVEWHVLPKEFSRMMGILLMGCAKDESRPVLTAICVSEGKLASADGFRLYAYENKDFLFGLGDKQALIPSTVVSKAVRLFGKEEKVEVGFDLSKNLVVFKSGGTTLVGQLVQGTYPRYQQLIPETFQSKVSFSVPLMMERLSMLDWVTNEGSGIVKFVFSKGEMKEDLCLLSSRSEELGDCELTLPIKMDTQEYAKIAFNYRYIKDVIKPFSMCSMELTSTSSPGKFTGDIEGLTVVLMPIFCQWTD